jgi:hypothetical protein
MDELTAKDVALLVLGMTVTILWAFIVIFYVEWWRLKRTLNPPWADPRVPVTWELSITRRPRPKQD